MNELAVKYFESNGDYYNKAPLDSLIKYQNSKIKIINHKRGKTMNSKSKTNLKDVKIKESQNLSDKDKDKDKDIDQKNNKEKNKFKNKEKNKNNNKNNYKDNNKKEEDEDEDIDIDIDRKKPKNSKKNESIRNIKNFRNIVKNIKNLKNLQSQNTKEQTEFHRKKDKQSYKFKRELIDNSQTVRATGNNSKIKFPKDNEESYSLSFLKLHKNSNPNISSSQIRNNNFFSQNINSSISSSGKIACNPPIINITYENKTTNYFNIHKSQDISDNKRMKNLKLLQTKESNHLDFDRPQTSEGKIKKITKNSSPQIEMEFPNLNLRLIKKGK